MTRILITIAAVTLLSAPAWAQAVSDAQIASIVVTANQVDVDAGALAAERASSEDVKAFARTMVTDHNAVNQAAAALVTRLGVTPEQNPTSVALKNGGDANLAALRKLEGAAFDEAYVEHEVAYHQQVLDALDKVLIPNASNAELKEMLVNVRPAFVAHLEHAQHLHASLSGSH